MPLNSSQCHHSHKQRHSASRQRARTETFRGHLIVDSSLERVPRSETRIDSSGESRLTCLRNVLSANDPNPLDENHVEDTTRQAVSEQAELGLLSTAQPTRTGGYLYFTGRAAHGVQERGVKTLRRSVKRRKPRLVRG